MTVQIVTSTLGKIKSTSKGQKFYTVTAQEFAGIQESVENGIRVNRIKLGQPVDIFKTQDIRKATTFIKKCQLAGSVVELQLP